MKNIHFFFAFAFASLLFLSLSSCQKEVEETAVTTTNVGEVFSPDELADINAHFCSTLDENDYNDRSESVEDRATGLKGKFWPAGQTLRVRFMNGSSALQTKVLNYAKTWSAYANVSFTKVTSGTSEIRVLFGNNGSNSYIGTDNKSISQSSQTMNLQLKDNSSEADIRQTVLHEFGHALGLKHEHQNPLANIPWNRPKVYAYYAQFGWTTQRVDEQVLNNAGWGPAQHTGFDSQSIMAYSIPASLTTNGFSIPWNSQLSALDKEFIGKMYSGTRMKITHSANITNTITFYLNGMYTTLNKNESIYVPVKTAGNTLQIWECPNSCQWSSYNVTYGKSYKIMSAASNPNDLVLIQQ